LEERIIWSKTERGMLQVIDFVESEVCLKQEVTLKIRIQTTADISFLTINISLAAREGFAGLSEPSFPLYEILSTEDVEPRR
jgi:hypothetical protein